MSRIIIVHHAFENDNDNSAPLSIFGTYENKADATANILTYLVGFICEDKEKYDIVNGMLNEFCGVSITKWDTATNYDNICENIDLLAGKNKNYTQFVLAATNTIAPLNDGRILKLEVYELIE